ncbi:MAG: 4'-phosphopantetheinyl transferase superfamily protein [Paracoccaceae bacterium]|nr:4'-phosphopantetheinyl transferase superfamily protein [Paracoccaceae bacterium]
MSDDTLLTCLQALAGDGIHVAVEPVTDNAAVMAEEAPAIAKAIDKRKTEFAAGRRAARRALEPFGHGAATIPRGDNRAPVWPDGLVGSISHDAGVAIAAVAHTAAVTHLGLDLAEAAPFPERLRSQILLTPAETALNGLEARAVFSAKESVFKALHPDVQAFFGFAAVEVIPDLGNGRFRATLRDPLGDFPEGTILIGKAHAIDAHLVTLLALYP